ncbi:MAG: lytic murein transglycosylase B [Legionella sp. 40-6]|nr:lytic murein transglycosylase B [Legionella sp.]OJY40900.1 MAG: lytic murein transglycosylase B [Legionella sp. 40-6]
MQLFIKFFSILLLSFTLTLNAQADTSFTKRKDVQEFIQMMIKQHGFNRQALISTLNQVHLLPQVIESMDKPYEKKNWDVYRDIFLTPTRVKGGIEYWMANQKSLDLAYKRYGVPPEIIVAILGVETLYGERQGENRVLDSLATLAFNYPKRAPYFKHELKEYLLLCREHRVPATRYKGSYAGAIGKPQFMPSSYRKFATNFANKGARDLVGNNEHVIASVANYFKAHGWQTNAKVAQHAFITGTSYKRLITNPRAANYLVSQLSSSGVRAENTPANAATKAALMEMTTVQGNEYWIAYPNFFVITRYNSSPQYALVVHILSQQLKEQWIALHPSRPKVYS